MHSSTFNSDKNYLLQIILFLILVAGSYLCINVAGFKFSTNPNPKGSELYTNDVMGKNELMKNMYSANNPDIIFIGSSTTKYHVSTNMFKSEKMHTFNYGLESHFFTAYPHMIENAIKAKPKVIAISIDSPELYFPLLSVEAAFNKGVNMPFSNILFFAYHYLQHPHYFIEIRLILRLLEVYIEQLNYYYINGFKVTNYIKAAYNRYNPAVATTPAKETKITNPEIDKKLIDCEPIGMSSTGFGCMNGDGVLLGIEKNVPYENFHLRTEYIDQRYNYVFVSILNDMIKKIRAAGIKPVIIFIPQFEDSVMNKELIRKTIDAEIVDMTHLPIPKEAWYNSGHFNAKGRYIYSSQLVKKMKRLLV